MSASHSHSPTTPSPGSPRPVVVVGGGLAGLAAALDLARAGEPVRLLEARSSLGGRAISQQDRGFVLNQGPHALYRRGHAARAWAEWGLSLACAHPVDPAGLLLRGEEATALPASPATIATVPWATVSERVRLAGFLAGLALGAGPPAGVETAAELAAHLGGFPGPFLLALARLTTYANAPEHLSAQALLEQLRLSLAGVSYVDGGWQTLVEDLARAAAAAGATLEVRRRVRGLLPTATGWRVELEGEHVEASEVVLAVPPAAAARLWAPLAPRLAGRQPALTACLDLGLRRLPEPGTRFAVGLDAPLYYSVHSATADLAPAGGALLHLAWARAPGDDADRRPELEALMDRLQPGWREEVEVSRYLPAMPASAWIPGVGPGARPPVADGARPGLLLAGDWVGDEGQLADAAVASGRRAAAEILSLRSRSAA